MLYRDVCKDCWKLSTNNYSGYLEGLITWHCPPEITSMSVCMVDPVPKWCVKKFEQAVAAGKDQNA